MGQIFAALGSRVTILEAAPRILASVDTVLAERLSAKLHAEGITVATDVQVDAIEGGEGRYRVRYRRAAETAQVDAEVVAMVVGRHPSVDGLGLENTAVRHDRHGVQVGAEMETGEPGIFATGDLVGQPMFAHWATAQALAVARHLLGQTAGSPRPETNSAVIFSRPELGIAGLTEEAARAAALAVACGVALRTLAEAIHRIRC